MRNLKHATVKARKDHRCDWCNSTISKGTKYQYSAHVDSGDFWTWKNHIHCNEIAQKLNMFDDVDMGVTMDDFMGFVKNEFSNIEQLTGKENPICRTFQDKLDFVLEHHKIKKTEI